jgi:hypothetical protein
LRVGHIEHGEFLFLERPNQFVDRCRGFAVGFGRGTDDPFNVGHGHVLQTELFTQILPRTDQFFDRQLPQVDTLGFAYVELQPLA